MAGYTQSLSASTQFKTFQQALAETNLQFVIPKNFKEIEPIQTATADVNVDYAVMLPQSNFQVWFKVKNIAQEEARFKASDGDAKLSLANPDSLYSFKSLSTAIKLAGKGNFTYKSLPQNVLDSFHADAGCSYQLNLRDMPETNHYKYGLLISLQKNTSGYILMLFLGNENGPAFYKKVNMAYYSVRFN